MKYTLLLTTLLLAASAAQAANSIPLDQQIGSFETKEVTSNNKLLEPGLGQIDGTISNGGITGMGGTTFPTPDFPIPSGSTTDRTEQAGKIIQAARDIVALGEEIYTLVQKGKPHNVTEYAPISIVPKDPISKEVIDPFDLEGFSMPVQRSFVATVKNGAGAEVVKFNYKVLYSYGGSYNGTGKYLTGVIIVPGSIKTTYGWDFSSTMKLSGIMNHGTRVSPIAGVMITVKYQMNSFRTAFERNDTIHITGAGQVQNFISR